MILYKIKLPIQLTNIPVWYMFWTSKAEYNEFESNSNWICNFLIIDRCNWSCILLTFLSLSLCLSLARVTKINFLLTISIHHQEKSLWELTKWPTKGKCFDLLSRLLSATIFRVLTECQRPAEKPATLRFKPCTF